MSKTQCWFVSSDERVGFTRTRRKAISHVLSIEQVDQRLTHPRIFGPWETRVAVLDLAPCHPIGHKQYGPPAGDVPRLLYRRNVFTVERAGRYHVDILGEERRRQRGRAPEVLQDHPVYLRPPQKIVIEGERLRVGARYPVANPIRAEAHEVGGPVGTVLERLLFAVFV